MDFTPRNWLVDDGRVFVINFEWSRRDVWVSDVARLYYDYWPDRPELQGAILAGYGRDLLADDIAVMRAWWSMRQVHFILWAREHRDTAFEDAARQHLGLLMTGSQSD